MRPFIKHIAKLAILPILAFTTACGIPELSAEDAARMSNNQLCQTYSFARQFNDAQRINRVRHELEKRGALSKRDLDDIKAQRIRRGMKEHVAICSWGPYQDINSTTVGGYQSKQFVINLGTYFYTENGRVYAWQD